MLVAHLYLLNQQVYHYRFHFYPKNSTIRGGYVNFTECDDVNFRFYSVAFRNKTIACGGSAFTSGYTKLASCLRSATFNSKTVASGSYSNFFGADTKAEAFYSTAIGAFNIGGGDSANIFSTDPVFEVGIGKSDIDRSNALTVLNSGKVGIETTSPSRIRS